MGLSPHIRPRASEVKNAQTLTGYPLYESEINIGVGAGWFAHLLHLDMIYISIAYAIGPLFNSIAHPNKLTFVFKPELKQNNILYVLSLHT